jgi:hypothetical protein
MPTTYRTKAVTIGDITVTVSKAGKTGAEKVAALIRFIAEKIKDPNYGIEEGARPDQGLPGQQPGPDQGLPGEQPGPDQGLPGGSGGTPDQGLPGNQPEIDNSLPGFLSDHADEIAKAVLKGTLCDPAAAPKK